MNSLSRDQQEKTHPAFRPHVSGSYVDGPVIRVVDLETTGFTPETGAPCEIGWCDIAMKPDLAGGHTMGEVLDGGCWLLDPGHPIPPENSAIHHIVDEDVRAQPSWPFARAVFTEAGVPVLAFAAHNARTERQWCGEWAGDTPWICTYRCALRLWPDAPSHSNQALRYWRRPDGLSRKKAFFAHRAFPDAYVTAFLLRDLMIEAQAQGFGLDSLIEWSGQPALQVRCHIGAWRGHKWAAVDDGFLQWVSERDFDEDVLFTVRHEMERRQKEWEDREAEG
ncbi:MAG: 3'-5' exonuclease [bacterium]